MATDFEAVSSATYTPTYGGDTVENPDSVLGKDDFMKLLLTELQYQDPTDPMDSDKILEQTSELATLESADNTNKAMEQLVDQLSSSSDLSTISAIGKMGSLGADSIALAEGDKPTFDMYFNHDVQSGSINITDVQGNIVKTIDLSPQEAGVQSFQWDGTDNSGNQVTTGNYSITADYTDGSDSYTAAYGTYPIESVRFDSGQALLKMGNNYYPMDSVKEIYQ